MRIRWSPGGVPSLWGRAAATAAAILVAAGILTAAAAEPALADSGDQIYLRNDPSFGMYAAGGVVQGSRVAVKGQPWGRWAVIAASGGQEIAAVTTAGQVTNRCIATTVLYQGASLQPCGANGTIFIHLLNGDGVLLYSRYFLNRGQDDVLVVCSPDTGVSVAARPVNDVGGSCFGRWTDTFGAFL